MRAGISNNISTLMKNFMSPLPPSSAKNTFVGVIKQDFQKVSNNAIKFMPSVKALSTAPAKELPLSERNMRAGISKNISTLMKNFMSPLPPSSEKNTFVGVIKHDFQKGSNNAIKFMPSAKALSTAPAKELPLSERKVINARKPSDNFASKFGTLMQNLNSRFAAGPSPIRKPLVATPAPAPVMLSTFTPPAPVKPGKMGMPPPPPPMPPASYVPPRIIQTDMVSSAPVVREKKSIKPETTPQYNSVMDELKKRLEASSLKAQTVNH
ncbi:hypothetical protein ACWWJF_12835 [Symbiopectobacterium sp. Eva_TO]